MTKSNDAKVFPFKIVPVESNSAVRWNQDSMNVPRLKYALQAGWRHLFVEGKFLQPESTLFGFVRCAVPVEIEFPVRTKLLRVRPMVDPGQFGADAFGHLAPTVLREGAEKRVRPMPHFPRR